MTAPVLTGQDIGVTARATRAVLDQLLAEAGTDFDTWIALRLVAQAGRVPRDELPGLIVTNLAAEASAGPLAVQRLTAQGWYTTDSEQIELTPAGAAFYGRLLGQVGEITTELYGGLDPADLAAAKRVLAEVARRANLHIGQ